MGGGGGSFGHIHWCEEEEGAGRWPRASTGFPYGCRHSIQKLVLADNYKWRRYEGLVKEFPGSLLRASTRLCTSMFLSPRDMVFFLTTLDSQGVG